MKHYSSTNTIIVWSANPEILKITKELGKKLGVNIFEPEHITDLIAIPSFLKIIDAKYLIDLIKHLDKGVKEYFEFQDSQYAIYGELKIYIPHYLNEYIETVPYVVSKKLISALINKNLNSAIGEEGLRNKQFKNRAFRIISLFHIIKTKGYIQKEKIIDRFEVGPKTLQRDLAVLRKVDPAIDITFNDKGALTTIRTINFKNTAPPKKINLNEQRLERKIQRLLNLYSLLENNKAIQVTTYCAKYSKSERALRGDIKTLREVNPERSISFDKTKGYY